MSTWFNNQIIGSTESLINPFDDKIVLNVNSTSGNESVMSVPTSPTNQIHIEPHNQKLNLSKARQDPIDKKLEKVRIRLRDQSESQLLS